VYRASDLPGGVHSTLDDAMICAVEPGSMRLVHPPQGGSP
jgi:hypothetical protein